MAPRVAVLHHRRSFTPFELFHQIGESAELVWVLDDETSSEPSAVRHLRHLGEVVVTDGLDLEQIVRKLREARVEGIVSFVDNHLEKAAAIAERLGLRYHSPAVAEVMTDKRLQRQVLDKAGIPGPCFWAVPDRPTAEELAAIGAQVRFPAVLKPARGSGSAGIVHLQRVEEITALVDEPSDCGWIIEEFLEDSPEHDREFASYLSLESVVSAGAVTHVAITGRFPLAEPFRETGNFVPGVLEAELDAPVHEMVTNALVALGVTDAVVHSEIKLTPDGPKMIEINGRLGGRPPFVLLSISNTNLFRAAIDVALGRPPDLGQLFSYRGVGFWLMLQPPMSARAVARIDGVPELHAIAAIDAVDLRCRAGDPVDWHLGTDAAVLTVRGTVANHRQLAETIRHIHNSVTFVYEE